jgi:hypothetical protein
MNEISEELYTRTLNKNNIGENLIEIFPLINVSISLQSLYITKVVMQLRRIFYPSKSLRIGFIGCGTIGTLLLRSLIDFTGILSNKFYVSSRTPEKLQNFEKEGVHIFWDNQRIINECDLIFVTVLPHQLVCGILFHFILFYFLESSIENYSSISKPIIFEGGRCFIK